ncbi:hypothetical protein WMF47_02180 [Sorangium sp. So ce861]
MEAEIAAPGVQHAGDTDVGAEPLGIPAERDQGLRAALEEQIEDRLLVDERQRAQLGREREDDMEVVRRQDAQLPLGDPPGLAEALALGTVAVAAGVVRGTGGSFWGTFGQGIATATSGRPRVVA